MMMTRQQRRTAAAAAAATMPGRLSEVLELPEPNASDGSGTERRSDTAGSNETTVTPRTSESVDSLPGELSIVCTFSMMSPTAEALLGRMVAVTTMLPELTTSRISLARTPPSHVARLLL